MLGKVDEIIKNGILLDTQISVHSSGNKKGSTQFMHYLYTPISINGAPFIAKLSIEEYVLTGKNRAYNLQRIELSEVSRAQFSQLIEENRGKYAYTSDALSVSQLFKLVKNYDTEFTPKPVNPHDKRFRKLKYVKKVATLHTGVLSDKGGLTRQVTTDYSISDLFKLVKNYDAEFKPKPVNPHDKRFHKLKYIEKVTDNIGGRTCGNNRSGGSTNDVSITNYSISDLYSFVNQYDEEFSPGKMVAPILLNEDGTPKVFYHGAKKNGGFTEYQ